jgi:soluble lytic murein transglycosylase-like protein
LAANPAQKAKFFADSETLSYISEKTLKSHIRTITRDIRMVIHQRWLLALVLRSMGVLAIFIGLFVTYPSLLYLDDPPELSGDLSAMEMEIARFIMGYAEYYGLDPALLRAIIQVESNFNPTAVSPKGARGLMQLMPLTAAALHVLDPFDPGENIRAGAAEVRRLLDRFHGDMRLALAAYHAGEGRVMQYLGVPPLKSTQVYVERVLRVHKGFVEAQDASPVEHKGRLSDQLSRTMMPIQ